MKKIYVFLFSVFFLHSFSQAPKLINYQGIVRNALGSPVTSPVKLKFEIFPVSSGGSSVFSEIQSTSTNSLGLFSTQIGKNTPLNINWSTGSWFLELSVDTTNTGNSFTIVGRQQMVSVPFALYAENAGSAPAPSVTFSNNVLYVGTNSVSLPPAPVYLAGNGIAINSGSIINTAPNQTITISGAGNAVVNGPYPDFTVTATPQVLAINNNVISLSNGGGSVVLPATSTTPNTSLTATGIATVTSSGTNTFNIAVAQPSITGSGGTSVGGIYPNLIISSPTVAAAITPTINGNGIAVVSPTTGNSFNVNVPGPSLSYGANVLSITQGTSTSAVTIPAGVTPSISGTGVANVNPSAGSSFTVNVPPPTLTYGSNVLSISQGSATSVVTIPAGITPTITGAGIATVTPLSGNNFTVNVAPLNLTGLGSATIGGTYPNLTINTPIPSVPPAAWLIQGNSGTIDGTHFLGNSDNVPLNFRVNNQKSGRIDPLLSNSFFGYWAGRDMTTGTQNTAMGVNALYNTTTGVGNAAIGVAALGTNTVGNNNTAIGNWAGYSNNGSNNVFIGYQAGYNANGSNQLHIANSNSGLPLVYGDFSTGRIGLGNTAPATRLDVTGTSQFIDNATTSGYSTLIQNNIGSGISGGALEVTSSGQRSIGNNAVSILNLVTKSGGSGSTKTGLSIQSTGSWAPGTNQPNVGLSVNVGGADINNSAIFMGGNVGIGTTAPVSSSSLHVNGGVTITDGTQGLGKVLTSDATGNAAWKPLNVVTSIAFNGKFLSSIGNTPTLLQSALCSFTKGAADTRLEVVVQTALFVGDLIGTNSVLYEVRLNGSSPLSNTGRANYYIDNNGSASLGSNQQVSMTAEFPALATGTYNVEVWVYAVNAGGTASNVYVDNGNFSASSVIIKEYR